MTEKILNSLTKWVKIEPYAKKIGMELVELGYGHSKVKMTFKEDMENMFGMAHGGAIFSLIDEAFETASNSHGTVATALSMNVTFIRPPMKGDLFATAEETSRSKRIGTYDIDVKSDKGELIATCQAIVYRKQDKLPFLD